MFRLGVVDRRSGLAHHTAATEWEVQRFRLVLQGIKLRASSKHRLGGPSNHTRLTIVPARPRD